jgi:plastocyanin
MANYSSLKNAGILTPVANTTLGTPTATYKDLYLAANANVYLGNTVFSSDKIFPFNLTIAPETLTIQVSATDPGDDITWFWTWETSTLPYARTAITNSAQISVPMYKQGTYTINNFAGATIFGNMTQTHHAYLKWIDGYGTQNLVSWAVEGGNVNVTHPSINGGVSTSVSRITVTVPSTVTPPTLTQPAGISYNVSFVNTGAYTIGGAAQGDNKGIGPLYRGSTYTFNLASSIESHPFYLTTDNGTSFVSGQYVGEYTTGVTGSRNNGTTGKTTLTFTVPNSAPDVLYYQCGIHSMMRGTITIRDLAVETNINGNYVLYFQHTDEGHKTPIEIRPIPSLVNQMCVVYDASVGKFVPQDLATYVENTPSFKNKIREVAGTATLVAADGVAVVPTVAIVEDPTYLPLVNNKVGDISYSASNDTIYLWNGTAWKTKTNTVKKYITMNQSGTITVPVTGTARLYPPSSLTITNVYASLSTTSSSTFTFQLLKNGSVVGTYNISSGTNKMTTTAANISLITTDYLTVNVTAGTGASDLRIDLEYIVTLA